MGKAPSIEEMQATEDEFDAWVAKRTKAVVSECSTARDGLQKKFEEDFAHIEDWVVLRDKYFADFSHEESFSLAAISTIIKQISGALFGVDEGGPEKDKSGGVEVTKPELSAGSIGALAGFGGVEALIAAKAMNLIAGILEVFNTQSSLKGTFQSGLEAVAPGLYVGVSSRRTEYSGQSFFNDTTVTETYFVVIVKFSDAAWRAGQGISDDMALGKALEMYRATFEKNIMGMLETGAALDAKSMELAVTTIKDFKANMTAMEGIAANTSKKS